MSAGTEGTAPAVVYPLLEDGALALEVEVALAPLLERWLPLIPYGETASAPRALVRIVRGGRVERPAGARMLFLSSVDVWVSGEEAALWGSLAGCSGRVDLAAPGAELVVPHDAEPADAAAELFPLVTFACALLLGRLRRALTHAAAVVAPGGGAWLLVGDTHAGKSTTCANLLSAGWRYVSDDHVVLSRDGGGIRVEGWPRRFHLDEGWRQGAPLHRRGETDPRERWPGRWVRSAPLAGLLFPRVEAERPTKLGPVAAADALARLLRQSPWLLGDAGSAPDVLDLLRAAASHPAAALRLGVDTWDDADRLVEVLGGVLSPES